MEEEAEEMAGAIAIFLLTSPKSSMISDLPAFIFKYIALTRLYPQTNALEGKLLLDRKMVFTGLSSEGEQAMR